MINATQEMPLDIIRSHAFRDPNRVDRVVLDHPKLRYLTRKQAEEWLRIGSFENVHTRSAEIAIIESHIDGITDGFDTEVIVVDFGCGDGAKGARVILALEGSGYQVTHYYPVDVNDTLIDASIRRALEWTNLDESQCSGLCISFEDIVQTDLPWKSNDRNAATVLGLFLGNTFNNYEPKVADELIKNLGSQCHYLLLGAKVRQNSSHEEIDRIIGQYQSYGNAFTLGFGRVLGLAESSMTRLVEYNFVRSRIEVSIQIAKEHYATTTFPSGITNLLVCSSYKPTKCDIITRLLPMSQITSWCMEDSDDVVFRIRVGAPC